MQKTRTARLGRPRVASKPLIYATIMRNK